MANIRVKVTKMNNENKYLILIDGSGYVIILNEPDCDDLEEWVQDNYGYNCHYSLAWSINDQRQ